MAATPPRYLEKFENGSGTVSYTFPLNGYEWQSVQTLRRLDGTVVGAGYAHDHFAGDAWPKGVALETVRGLIVDATVANLDSEFDTMKQKVLNTGRGKLYTLTAAAVRRWAWAKVLEVPEVSVNPTMIGNQPFMLRFARFSDWFASSATVSGPTTVTTSPRTITVNNPGNAPVLNAIILLEANTALGFTNPSINNTTNGYTIATTRDSAADTDSLEIDAGRWSVEFNGANDFDKVTLGTAQVGLMRLEPGDNDLSFSCDGTPNYDVTVTFYAGYH